VAQKKQSTGRLGLVSSHDCNLSASGVFDILALYKLDYCYCLSEAVECFTIYCSNTFKVWWGSLMMSLW